MSNKSLLEPINFRPTKNLVEGIDLYIEKYDDFFQNGEDVKSQAIRSILAKGLRASKCLPGEKK